MPIATHKTIVYKTPELTTTTYEAIKSYIARKNSQEGTDGNKEEQKVSHQHSNVEASSSNKLDATVIQQQLQALEVKLEVLKGKKHNLFLELKKVLHGEDNNRRNVKEQVNADTNPSKPAATSTEAEGNSKPSSADSAHGEISAIETITTTVKRERDDSTNNDVTPSHKQMKYSMLQQNYPYSPFYMQNYRHFNHNKNYRSPQKNPEEQSFTRPIHVHPHLAHGISPFHLQQRFATNPQQLLPQQPSPMFFPGQMHPLLMPQMGLPSIQQSLVINQCEQLLRPPNMTPPSVDGSRDKPPFYSII
ncbi:uncharacterized protein TRIADDRAFT_57341 [Trichoplax adhaerens]|uniref:Uncharacterized protein n=1 Tax=Trichoplax adhaerens TaxID=10228 RepID=B3RZ63_TRIAD|nr:predicted protein [Trichoplax adhaerens]EDV23787.1 predicted protein [Trichoplax adhaerens]|eukprot:XP_002113313.1 predicted protein [Trichoplax adhaerens]